MEAQDLEEIIKSYREAYWPDSRGPASKQFFNLVQYIIYTMDVFLWREKALGLFEWSRDNNGKEIFKWK
jgi:hypothetical protein